MAKPLLIVTVYRRRSSDLSPGQSIFIFIKSISPIMFEKFLGHTTNEDRLFYTVSDDIIKNYSRMKDFEFYFFRLTRGGEGQSTICEVRHFVDYYQYAEFIFAHKLEPQYLVFQKHENSVKVVMTGFYKFMAHEIHSSGFKYVNIHDCNPDRKPCPMISRNTAEKGFAEIAACLSSAKPPRSV